MVTNVRANIGDDVIYVSEVNNGEGNDVLSPAKILRTRRTTVPSVLFDWKDKPDALVAELEDSDVDLIVFGLGQTYRRYAVGPGFGRGQYFYPHQLVQYEHERQ